MSLSSIINVQISRETKVPSRAGFGEAAFVSEDAVFKGRWKAYASLTEVQNDDLAGADVVQFATRYFGQELAPPRLHVVKKGRDLAHVQVLKFDSDLVAANSFSVDVNGTTVGPVAFNTDHDTTMSDIATALAANGDIATAVVGGTNNREITITGAANNAEVALTNAAVTGGASQPSITITTTQYWDEVKTYTDSLADAQTTNNEWYAVAIASRAEADVLAVAAWVEAQVKIFGTASSDAAILGSGTSDIISQLKALGYDRTFADYSAVADGSSSDPYPEAAAFGGVLPKDPGSVSWAYKSRAGVAVDVLDTTSVTNVLSKNGGVYTDIGGLSLTRDGKMVSGEYIDTIRGSDWIQVRTQEEVLFLLANEDKIPYTNDGIAQIEGKLRSVLTRAVNQSIISDFTITTPDASAISKVDKGNRLLPDVEFSGTLAGAIHKTQIQGRLVL